MVDPHEVDAGSMVQWSQPSWIPIVDPHEVDDALFGSIGSIGSIGAKIPDIHKTSGDEYGNG